jgi:hypothetical protein
MIQFNFNLSTKLFDKSQLVSNYSLEYLNDWLSYESELKYLFFFGEVDENYDLSTLSYPKSMEDIICLLRHNKILTNEDKKFILSIYIEDAFVSIENQTATLHVILDSENKHTPINSKIIQFLLNHIYNQCHSGLFKNGIIRPLTESEKIKYKWIDEIGWSQHFLEQTTERIDSLYFSEYTFITSDTSIIPHKPVYVSNYNLECFEISKCIDLIQNDIHRYKKSIKFLDRKKKELKKEKSSLYKLYRDSYLNMLDNDNKKWHFKHSNSSSNS